MNLYPCRYSKAFASSSILTRTTIGTPCGVLSSEEE
jgi:hypothetical protein